MDLDDIGIGCDYTLAVSGLSDAATGDYLNAATVTYTLYDAAGAAVASGTGALTHVTGSDGNYRGVVQSTVTAGLARNARYRFRVVISEGSYNDERHLWARAKYRGAA